LRLKTAVGRTNASLAKQKASTQLPTHPFPPPLRQAHLTNRVSLRSGLPWWRQNWRNSAMSTSGGLR
jgi:hypothetical protein